MSDIDDLTAAAEACKDHQPLRFMRTDSGLYIRNDNGIVFQVFQNPSFPTFMSENKDYAELALAATPDKVLALVAKIAMLEPAPEGYVSGEHAAQVADELGHRLGEVEAERDKLKAEVEELRKDSARLNRLDAECKAYGTDVHEGNRWVLDGPFATARDAIDAILESEVRHEAGN